MSTTTWHAPPELLRAYVDGTLDAVLSASLERHVDGCAECRGAIRPLGDLPLLDEAWSGVRRRVETSPLPWPLRIAQRLGLRETTAILLAAAASMRTSWLSGAFVALGFAGGATALTGGTVLWPFLLVAPLIPVIGVAAAYGSGDDDFEVLAVATPYGRARLTLVRTVAVVATTLPVAAILGSTLPWPTWVAVAWLGPALALLPLVLALASLVGPRPAGAVVALTWSGLVLLSTRRASDTWPLEASQQYLYLALAVASVAVLVVRSLQTRRMGVAL